MVIQVQILDETVYISICANGLGKGSKPSVLSQLGRLGSLALVRQPVKEK